MQTIRLIFCLNTLMAISSLGYGVSAPVLKSILLQPDTIVITQPDTLQTIILETGSIIHADTNFRQVPDTLITGTGNDFTIKKDSIPSQPRAAKMQFPIDSTRVDFYVRHFDSLYLGATYIFDTSLTNVVDFDAVFNQKYKHASLSNAGLAHQSQILTIPFYNGFDLQQHAFKRHIRDDASIRYLMPKKPFTEIYYIMGSKKENQLQLSFARALSPRLYIGMDYNLVSSPGPYRRSKSNNRGVYFTLRYHTQNQRYGASAYFVHNKLIVEESGGIVNDSLFEYNIEPDRRVIPVNLLDAQNEVKHSGFGIEQYFNLSPPRITAAKDTQQHRRIQIGRITHRMQYSRNQLHYTDRSPTANFYKPFDPILDSAATNDSVYQMVVRNSLHWSTLGYEPYTEEVPFYLYGGIEQAYIEHRSYSNFSETGPTATRTINQLIPFAGIRIGLFRSSYLDGRIRYITGDYSPGDLELEAGWKQYLGTTGRNIGNLFFRMRVLNQTPSWFHQQYTSNYFRWENNFDNSRYVSLTGGYQWMGISAGGRVQVLDRHIYLNRQARPEQTSGTVRVLHLFTNFNLNPGKFNMVGSINYQTSDNDTIISLPELSAKLKFTFTQVLFKGTATVQPGFSISYNTPYYANAYMPALRSFYLQNTKKIGGYPYVDVFLGLKVKRSNLFVRYTNLYAFAGDHSYYTVPGYPQRDPTFYFGLSWRFYE